MNDLFGWLGCFFFSICAIPQAWQSYREKSSAGISGWLLGLWFLGEVFAILYVLPRWDWPLLVNYSLNLFCLGVIVRYKWTVSQ